MILPFAISSIPIDGQNSFGAIRKFDIHTGVDLFCEEGERIYAMESGTIVNISFFTGKNAGSPWWNDTYVIMIESNDRVIAYGEILPANNLKIGQQIQEGNFLGNVMRVLKTYKGKPMTMLHLEFYTLGTKEPVWWMLNESQPKNLLDPTQTLLKIIKD